LRVLRNAATLTLPFPPLTLIVVLGNRVGLCGDATRYDHAAHGARPGSWRVNGPHGPGRYAAGTVLFLPHSFALHASENLAPRKLGKGG
jgi:hypothetical protein